MYIFFLICHLLNSSLVQLWFVRVCLKFPWRRESNPEKLCQRSQKFASPMPVFSPWTRNRTPLCFSDTLAVRNKESWVSVPDGPTFWHSTSRSHPTALLRGQAAAPLAWARSVSPGTSGVVLWRLTGSCTSAGTETFSSVRSMLHQTLFLST